MMMPELHTSFHEIGRLRVAQILWFDWAQVICIFSVYNSYIRILHQVPNRTQATEKSGRRQAARKNWCQLDFQIARLVLMADDRQIQRGQNERAGWIGGVLKGLFFAFSRLSGIRALVVLTALTVCSCMQATSDVTSADHPNASDTIRSIDLQPRFPKATGNVEPNRGGPAPASYFGTP